MLFAADRLVFVGGLLLAAQKRLMLLCQKKKQVTHPGFVVGGLDAVDRKALKAGMLIVRDSTTYIEFIVDSGSCRSVILCRRPATHPSVTRFMSCLNDSEVSTFESIELELALNLGRSFSWTSCTTLGLDFNHFDLLVNACRGKLVLPDENPVDCTNQQPPQRGGAVPDRVWVGLKWLLAFPRVSVDPSFLALCALEM